MMSKLYKFLFLGIVLTLFLFINVDIAKADIISLEIISPTQINPVSVTSGTDVLVTFNVESDATLGYPCQINLSNASAGAIYSGDCQSGVFENGSHNYTHIGRYPFS